MAVVFALSNQKGGVGKTTSAVSIAAQLAEFGYKTLLIDLDPQCSASSGLRVEGDPETGDIYDLFLGKASIPSITVATDSPTLFVVPSSRDLISLELEIGKAPGRELILQEEISKIRDKYDVILFDCPPSSGLLTLNALGAADGVLIPLQAEYYALEGISALMETVEFVRQTFNPRLSIFGVFLTMYDSRTNLSRQVEDEATQFFGDRMFGSRIPRSIRLSECPSHGLPICRYDPISTGAVAYRMLCEEISNRAQLQRSEDVANG